MANIYRTVLPMLVILTSCMSGCSNTDSMRCDPWTAMIWHEDAANFLSIEALYKAPPPNWSWDSTLARPDLSDLASLPFEDSWHNEVYEGRYALVSVSYDVESTRFSVWNNQSLSPDGHFQLVGSVSGDTMPTNRSGATRTFVETLLPNSSTADRAVTQLSKKGSFQITIPPEEFSIESLLAKVPGFKKYSTVVVAEGWQLHFAVGKAAATIKSDDGYALIVFEAGGRNTATWYYEEGAPIAAEVAFNNVHEILVSAGLPAPSLDGAEWSNRSC